MFENLEMPHFSHLILKMGHFKILEHKKVGHFEKKHVIVFKTAKQPKMARFDMRSRAKYLLHILFGAFLDFSKSELVILLKK